MLKAGYTAVGEFHYLHHAPDGRPYADRGEMSARLVDAAARAGIAITLLPVLYAAEGFGDGPPLAGQRRFLHDAGAFVDLVADLYGRWRDDPRIRLGIAPHSLRAVPPAALKHAIAGLRALDAEAPIHIHIAEQLREVEECRAFTGKRPVEWLLDHAPVDERWCLVHATHMTPAETQAVALSGAVAGLCPTTEANLGDGLFPLKTYLDAGGRLGVGSDSHVLVSAAEELRWLEYGQRLAGLVRNVAAPPGRSTGGTLYRAATEGGAQALAQPVGALAPGRQADIVVLEADHPALAARSGDAVLDGWLFFGGDTTPVRDVMVAGHWAVKDGRYPDEEAVAEAYRRTLV